MLSDFALRIIKKHGKKDSKNIFPFLGNPSDGKYTHRNFASTLKRISQAAKIEPHLTTKTPRYVFRTTAGSLLIHDLVLETILGHVPTSINHKYQKGLPNDVLDREHQKVLDEVFLTFLYRLEKKGEWDFGDYLNKEGSRREHGAF